MYNPHRDPVGCQLQYQTLTFNTACEGHPRGNTDLRTYSTFATESNNTNAGQLFPHYSAALHEQHAGQIERSLQQGHHL